MQNYADEAKHRGHQTDRLEPVLPHREAERDSRLRRKVSILLRLSDVMQNINHMGAADGIGIVNAGVGKSRNLAKLGRALLGKKFHVVLGAEVQTPSGTRLDTRG